MLLFLTVEMLRLSVFPSHTCVLSRLGEVLNHLKAKHPLALLVKDVLEVATVGVQRTLLSLSCCCCCAVLVPPRQSINQERLEVLCTRAGP